MDKTRLTGWLLIMALFFGMLFYNMKQQQEAQKNKQLEAENSVETTQTAERIDSVKLPKEIKEMPNPVIASLSASSDSDSTSDFENVAEERKISLETKTFVVQFSTRGAAITSILVKGLIGKDDDVFPEIIPQSETGALTLRIGQSNLQDVMWFHDEKNITSEIVGPEPEKVKFYTFLPSGVRVERIYTVRPDGYSIGHQLIADGVEEDFILFWTPGMLETEKFPEGKGIGLSSNFFSEVVLNNGSSILREHLTKPKTFNESSGIVEWVGLRRKYVAALINFGKETNYRITATPLVAKTEKSNSNNSYSLEISGQENLSSALNFEFLILPLKYSEILSYHQGYEQILFSGWEIIKADVWYVKLCGMVLKLLNMFHSLVPNYGLAIILLTLLVRSVLLPLTISQTKSMTKIQEHAPAIKEIKEKNKGNPQKANLEVMAYYKQMGVNPLAPMMGCLPMVLQLPVFISLFHVLGRALELKEEPFFGWISDLSRPDVIISAIQIPYVFPEGITILPLFMAATMYVQMKMTITDPNQRGMVYIMPVMMLFFSASFPSGLVLYWTISNIFTIVQTAALQRHKKIPALALPSKKSIPLAPAGKKSRRK